ncbi:hypothetical protein CAEBREN_18597 [Caenorhabditis brenneri]|uniref:Uncharacterized protein n=1 Tax=Caenorhabditis brenneri TaxID=135651 RepID=G0MKH7_CAEBE|nr:hypothetical protein CAEBREN_18597 [Caenorhabditis brenneri]
MWNTVTFEPSFNNYQHLLNRIISSVLERCKEVDFISAQPEKEFEQASCRKPEANLKRNQIWKTVTSQLNEEFDGVVGYEAINASQAKKFEEYYRRRCQPDTPLSAELLAVIGQTSVAPPPPRNLRHHQCLDVEKLKEERLFFMVTLIKEIMKHTGLDKICHERSSNTNERRQAMWKFVTVTVNNRYFERLDVLIEAQVKKSFSNYKRRHPEFLEGTGICENIDGEGLEVTDVEMQEVREFDAFNSGNETTSSPKLENSDFTPTVNGKGEMNNRIGNENNSV